MNEVPRPHLGTCFTVHAPRAKLWVPPQIRSSISIRSLSQVVTERHTLTSRGMLLAQPCTPAPGRHGWAPKHVLGTHAGGEVPREGVWVKEAVFSTNQDAGGTAVVNSVILMAAWSIFNSPF